MQSYKTHFIEFALQNNALLFGEFILKSGRISPYFFNSACFNTGAAISKLGQFYAEAILTADIPFDMLFGTAYKGIPLVTSVAIALSEKHGIDKPYAFNRKEPKDHGEGGLTVGASLAGKVLIIDDVITAGLATESAAHIIQTAGAEMAGICIAMDRQERMKNELSSVEEVRQKYHIPVVSVIGLNDLLHYLHVHPQYDAKELDRISAYQQMYGVSKG